MMLYISSLHYSQRAVAFPLQSGDKEKKEALERASALKFHQKLNQFRKENKKDTLAWLPVLSGAALNHNLWMVQNSFSHNEKAGTPGFTGVNPSDRVEALRGEGLSSYRIGENIVFFTYEKPEYLSLDDAEALALQAFELWENSSGHRSNMLYDGYRYHGISFHIDEHGAVYGTSVFSGTLPTVAGKTRDNPPAEVHAAAQVQNKDEKPLAQNRPTDRAPSPPPAADARVLAKNLEKELKEILRGLAGSSRHTALNEAAAAHLVYVLTHGTEDSRQEKGTRNYLAASPHQRLKKVLGMSGALLGKPEWTTDMAFYRKEKDPTEERMRALVNEFQALSRAFLEDAGKGSTGYALRVQKKNDGYVVAAVLVHTRHKL